MRFFIYKNKTFCIEHFYYLILLLNIIENKIAEILIEESLFLIKFF